MARWVVANDVTLEQVTRCSCLFNRIMCSLSTVQYFGLPIVESSYRGDCKPKDRLEAAGYGQSSRTQGCQVTLYLKYGF